MAGQHATTAREAVTLGDSVQKMMVSMIRLTGAMAWFGVDKLQSSISPREGEGLPRAMDDAAEVFDSIADTLMENLESDKKASMKSVSRVAEQVVGQSIAGLSMVDPRRVFGAANELVQKSAEVMANWSGEANQPESDGKPRLAVEVLTTRSHTETGTSKKRRVQ